MLLTMLPTRVEAVLFSEVTFIWTLHFKTITDLVVKNGTRKIRRKNVCPGVPVGMNCKPHDRRGSLRVRGVERGMSVGVYSAACSDHSHLLVAQWFQFGAHSSVVRLFSLNNQIFSVTTSTGRIRLTQFVWFVRQCWNSPHRTHVPFFLILDVLLSGSSIKWKISMMECVCILCSSPSYINIFKVNNRIDIRISWFVHSILVTREWESPFITSETPLLFPMFWQSTKVTPG